MKTYEVEVRVPSKKKDWCIYSNKDIWIDSPITTAILTARNEEHLRDKIQKHYGAVDVLRISEITLQ